MFNRISQFYSISAARQAISHQPDQASTQGGGASSPTRRRASTATRSFRSDSFAGGWWLVGHQQPASERSASCPPRLRGLRQDFRKWKNASLKEHMTSHNDTRPIPSYSDSCATSSWSRKNSYRSVCPHSVGTKTLLRKIMITLVPILLHKQYYQTEIHHMDHHIRWTYWIMMKTVNVFVSWFHDKSKVQVDVVM